MRQRVLIHAATLGRFAREQMLVLLAATGAAAFLLSGRVSLAAARRAVDFNLLLVLLALLITVEILRDSGYLAAVVAHSVRRFHDARAFAAVMVLVSGALAALVTNDVALFVVIPFTVMAGAMSDFDVEDAVVLEVIATNLLGCLTPLGNPQNLFVYHRSGWSAGRFISTMAPFVAWSAAGLLIAIFLLRRSKRIEPSNVSLPIRKPGVAIAGAICFLLVVLEIARIAPSWIPAAAALVCAAVILGRRTLAIDLSIVPLFLFAFIIVEGMRTLDLHAVIRGTTYWVAIALSQVISNVPATVLMTPFAEPHWRELLYGVNAGGCGTIIASLANLLTWRIYVRESDRDPRFFWRLTWINLAFLGWAAAGGWWLLY